MSSYTWPTINEISSGVTSLNTLTGDVILAAGANITLTPSGNTITIAASGGGSPGGSDTQVQYNSSGSFAGTSLLTIGTDITLSANIVPNSDAIYSLGSGIGGSFGIRFLNIYSQNVYTDFLYGNSNGTITLQTPIIGGSNVDISGISNMSASTGNFEETSTNQLSARGDSQISLFTNIQPQFDISYDLGGPSNRFNNLYTSYVHADTIAPPSGQLVIGNATSDIIQFVAGDTGETPADPTAPSSWIKVKNNNGDIGFLPFYLAPS